MSNEIVPEVSVETPSVAETITPEVSTTPITQEQPEAPLTKEEEVELSEEEVDAAIEAILKDMPTTVVTEPTFFP